MIAEELRKRQKAGIRESLGMAKRKRGDAAGEGKRRWRRKDNREVAGRGRRKAGEVGKGRNAGQERKGEKRRRNEGRNEGIKRRTGAGKEDGSGKGGTNGWIDIKI